MTIVQRVIGSEFEAGRLFFYVWQDLLKLVSLARIHHRKREPKSNVENGLKSAGGVELPQKWASLPVKEQHRHSWKLTLVTARRGLFRASRQNFNSHLKGRNPVDKAPEILPQCKGGRVRHLLELEYLLLQREYG